MSVTDGFVRLYPGPFRDRWGPALETEARSAGWRAWPNLLVHMVDMWLHPAVWPAESRAQRRGRASVMVITAAALSWFLAHVAAETETPLAAAARGGVMSGCAVAMLVGLVLVAPRPRLTVPATTAVLRQAAHRLIVPAALGAVAVVSVHGGAADAPPPVRVAVLACWWSALALGAIQTCRMVGDLDVDVLEPPRPGRLRLGIWLLIAATAVTGAIIVGISTTGGRRDVIWSAVGAAVILLTLAFAGTLRDLRQVSAAE